MATKKCANGHLYDGSIYGDKCPFCPSTGETIVKENDMNATKPANASGETSPMMEGNAVKGREVSKPTIPNNVVNSSDFTCPDTVGVDINDLENKTILTHNTHIYAEEQNQEPFRRMVGLLVSYSNNPGGEVYKIHEGRTTIGRDRSCDISFPTDSHMSAKHLLIQYVGAKGVFRAQEFDKGSANGSYVNGKVYVLGDVIDLQNMDVIVLGSTKLLFLTIPEF